MEIIGKRLRGEYSACTEACQYSLFWVKAAGVSVVAPALCRPFDTRWRWSISRRDDESSRKPRALIHAAGKWVYKLK